MKVYVVAGTTPPTATASSNHSLSNRCPFLLSSRAKPRDLQFRGLFLETWDPTPPQTYLEPSDSSAIANNLLTVFQFRPVDVHCSVFSILTSGIFG
jgi:hypothetical protein